MTTHVNGVLVGENGGTGVNNGASTLTYGGNTSFVGAFTFAGTLTNNTAVTFPTSGTLATTADIPISPVAVNVTGTTQAMTAGRSYVANNASLVTLTLPTTAAFGTWIAVAGKGAGGWIIAQNAGQTIRLASRATSTGVAGTLNSTTQYDATFLFCTTADTDWILIGPAGNLNFL